MKDSQITKKVRKRITTKEGEKANHDGSYNDLYKKVNAENCIFCFDEHMREITYEGEEREQKWIPICKECHESIKDKTVVNEMRAIIARSRE